MIVVSDTSPITNLAAVKQLNLLKLLYTTVIIPEAVYHELTGTEFTVPGSIEVQILDWIIPQAAANRPSIRKLQEEHQLDEGESEAIALTIELNAELLLIDERRGRAEANRLGLRITGVLGVLIEAKSKGLIVTVKPIMDDLIKISEFWIAEELYRQILQLTHEIESF